MCYSITVDWLIKLTLPGVSIHTKIFIQGKFQMKLLVILIGPDLQKKILLFFEIIVLQIIVKLSFDSEISFRLLENTMKLSSFFTPFSMIHNILQVSTLEH